MNIELKEIIKCKSCTYKNITNNNYCKICHIPFNISDHDINIMKQTYDIQYKLYTTQNMYNLLKNMKMCKKCTYYNKHIGNKCVMCDTLFN